MELVSAVITTHNRLTLLRRAVQSVLDQTYEEIELIVVDDASVDGTQAWCEEQARRSGFRYIRIAAQESRGGNHARNIGVLSSDGMYVAFLDDDDYWLPEKIAKQVACIRDSDCELVHCGRREEIVSVKGIRYRDRLPRPDQSGDMRVNSLLTIPATTTNLLIRRDALLEVGLFDEELRYWQEYELQIRLGQRTPFGCVPEPLSVYRVDVKDPSRLTNRYYEWKDAVTYIRCKHADLYAGLRRRDRLGARVLVWKDGAKRCLNAGLWARFVLHGTEYVLAAALLRIWK